MHKQSTTNIGVCIYNLQQTLEHRQSTKSTGTWVIGKLQQTQMQKILVYSKQQETVYIVLRFSTRKIDS